jgi:hypothetical protein
MKRGPILHGVLLVAALLFAYQTWTREEVVEPTTGTVVLWSIPFDKLTAVTYETTIPNQESHAVRLERRRDEKGPYLWGLETRSRMRYPERDPSSWEFDAGVGAPDSYVPEADTKVYEFAVGERGAKVMEKVAEMRAIRDLGKVNEEQHELYGLDESREDLAVIHEGGTRRLRIGGKVFGSADRYALDPDSGRAYVIAHELIRELMTGEASLRMLEMHSYDDDEVRQAVLQVGAQKRTLVRSKVIDPTGAERKSWADAATPERADQTMANFLESIAQLRPSIYESERSPDEMKLLVRVEYQNAGSEMLGWVELYEMAPPAGDAAGEAAGTGDQPGQPQDDAGQEAGDAGGQGAGRAPKQRKKPIYYMRTELTRVLAAVPFNMATRVTEDIDQIFGR